MENLRAELIEIITDNIVVEELNIDSAMNDLEETGVVDDLVNYIHREFVSEQPTNRSLPQIVPNDVFFQKRMGYHIIIDNIHESNNQVTYTIVKNAGTQEQKSWKQTRPIIQLMKYLNMFSYTNLKTIK